MTAKNQSIPKNSILIIIFAVLVNALWMYARTNGLGFGNAVLNLIPVLVVQILDVIVLAYVLNLLLLRPISRKTLLIYERTFTELGVRLGGIAKKNVTQLDKSQEIWGELRDQVLGAIGAEAKFGKLKELRNDVKWLSKKEAKAIFENPATPTDVWLRILKLFNGSFDIYYEKRESLLSRRDISTTYVKPRAYERNLSNLNGLRELTRHLIKLKTLLDAVKSAPMLCLLIFIPSVNALFVGLGLNEFRGTWIPLGFFVASIALALFLRPQLNYALRFATQRLGIVGENLLVDAVSGLILAAMFGFFIYKAVQSSPDVFQTIVSVFIDYLWANPFRRILLIAGITWLVVFLLKDMIVFVLEKWAEQLAMRYDETFVSVAQKVAAIYVIIIASGVLIASFGGELGIKSPDTILFPYLFAVTLLTGILGYASRETLENFFAGVMIRMNPPFEIGDRIQLETGELCDVREIGMRTVTLYNVELNVEIYVPNKTASSMKVTNVSRPDLELRVQVPVIVKVAVQSLATAEQILIDVAYSEPEVDQMIIDDKEFGLDKAFWNRDRNRFSIRDLLGNLRRIYPRIEKTMVATGEIVAGKEGAMHLETFESVVDRALTELSKARRAYKRARGRKSRISCVARIISSYQKLSNAIYSIGDTLPDIKEDLDGIVAELSKEPVVHSKFEVSNSGVPYLALTLNVFAFHLERRFEVEHKLNSALLDRLELARLLVRGTRV